MCILSHYEMGHCFNHKSILLVLMLPADCMCSLNLCTDIFVVSFGVDCLLFTLQAASDIHQRFPSL